MSLIPGIAGQKTQFIDGLQTNSISELTTAAGITVTQALVPNGGIYKYTNGIAPGAGFIGEEKTCSVSNDHYVGIGWQVARGAGPTDLKIANIGKGIWDVMACCRCNMDEPGGNYTICLNTTAATDSGCVEGRNKILYPNNTYAANSNPGWVPNSRFYITDDTTTIYFNINATCATWFTGFIYAIRVG